MQILIVVLSVIAGAILGLVLGGWAGAAGFGVAALLASCLWVVRAKRRTT